MSKVALFKLLFFKYMLLRTISNSTANLTQIKCIALTTILELWATRIFKAPLRIIIIIIIIFIALVRVVTVATIIAVIIPSK